MSPSAKIVYEVVKHLPELEKKELYRLMAIPIPDPPIVQVRWIYQWRGLSEYLGGVPISTLKDWEREGLIKKYKLGRKVFFKPEEVDKAVIEVK